MMKKILPVFILAVMVSFQLSAQEEARLLRFPTVSGDQLVFSYAGDLYTTGINGGMARKLTSHNGYEVFPKFSPDGSEIAFTGQYDGNTEVFKIPAAGGEPVRLTHTATLGRDDIGDRMGPNNIVMAWSPDGEHIVYRSRKQSFNDFRGQLFTVPVSGGLSEEIPLTDGGFCSYSPDGSKLAFNWVFREFRTWKYYRGGMADDIRIYDFKTGKVEQISDKPAQDIIPMWIGREIYFLSDRDRIMNLFAYNTETGETRKVTNFTDYDIKFPSHSDKHIAFEKGGYIYLFDVETQESKKLSIQIAGDRPWARNEWKDASKSIREASLAPNGERVVFSARGDIWSLPAKNGITHKLTSTSGINERGAVWSPDGKHIAYISDATGEFEIYIVAQDGSGKPVQTTNGNKTYIFSLEWSPDSKKILYHNKKRELCYVDVESKKVTVVEQSDRSTGFSYSWSPDSKWITYTKPQRDMTIVRLYKLESKKSHEVTEGWYNSYNPSFSSDGKYLLFTSARDFNPVYSQTEWNHAYVDMSRIYLVTLAKETPSPFALENDVVKTEDKDGNDKKKEDAGNNNDLKIDIDGIQERIIRLPVSPGNYSGLTGVNGKIYYSVRSAAERGSTMKMYDLEKKKETELGSNVRYTLSPTGKKMLVRVNNRWGVIDLPSGKIDIKDELDVSEMKMHVNLQEEWKQMFDEIWRHMRDFFYDPGMHGVDWEAIHEKYKVLVPYVSHRSDLAYLMGEMIAELNVGHAYVNNGERPQPERIQLGLLGAQVSRDKSGYFRIDKILRGANWSSELSSPLRAVGVNVNEGDYIIAVDGIEVTETDDINTLLIGKAGSEILLKVNGKASPAGSREVLVKPIGNESSLYYYQWVHNNIEEVSRQTDGRVGYLHIPDMGVGGLNEFAKYYYPQLTKEGLIIDVRGNGGGNVSPMIIERLMRQLTYMTMHTGQQQGDPNPSGMHVGPKVTLLDKYSASDGDLFPYRFQVNELGPTIGTRSWGGVVGYSGAIPLIDGGSIITPSYAPYDREGRGFVIEGEGVVPDIIIENNPAELYKGIDAQLNKAVEVILEELEKEPVKLPPVPPFPDKSGKR
ncbi:MAG: PD40 domain-containing protein [Bacteroidales bacterium]|nr:PD40 domain-containing protein [Bacteroidales bacterium]